MRTMDEIMRKQAQQHLQQLQIAKGCTALLMVCTMPKSRQRRIICSVSSRLISRAMPMAMVLSAI